MQYVIEDLARLPVRVELASEYRYRNPVVNGELVIVISQSGETADSLAAMREAHKNGLKTLAIVNVLGSSIAREADYVFYTKAGLPFLSELIKMISSCRSILTFRQNSGLMYNRDPSPPGRPGDFPRAYQPRISPRWK